MGLSYLNMFSRAHWEMCSTNLPGASQTIELILKINRHRALIKEQWEEIKSVHEKKGK